MHFIKRTYSLPPETLKSFESKVPPAQRNALVAALLSDWLTNERRQVLRKEIAAGCQEMAAVYLEVEKEYHPLEEEVQRGLDDVQSKARGRGARTTRSRRGLGAGG